jgi:hypothetical protein
LNEGVKDGGKMERRKDCVKKGERVPVFVELNEGRITGEQREMEEGEDEERKDG